MVLLGKHQFKVTSIEPARVHCHTTPHHQESDSKGGGGNEHRHKEVDEHESKSSSLESMVGDAEALLLALEELSVSGGEQQRGSAEGGQEAAAAIQARMQRLREAASALSSAPVLTSTSSTSQPKRRVSDDKDEGKDVSTSAGRGEKEHNEGEGEKEDREAGDMRMGLVCFAPEGSPLIGASYWVARAGASFGRSKSNAISLMLEDRSIDNSVSQEHAHIEMDEVRASRDQRCDHDYHVPHQLFCCSAFQLSSAMLTYSQIYYTCNRNQAHFSYVMEIPRKPGTMQCKCAPTLRSSWPALLQYVPTNV